MNGETQMNSKQKQLVNDTGLVLFLLSLQFAAAGTFAAESNSPEAFLSEDLFARGRCEANSRQ